MFGNRKLKAEIVDITFRVRELEEKLCPGENHDWTDRGREYFIDEYGDVDVERRFVCSRCGKVQRTRFADLSKFSAHAP